MFIVRWRDRRDMLDVRRMVSPSGRLWECNKLEERVPARRFVVCSHFCCVDPKKSCGC